MVFWNKMQNQFQHYKHIILIKNISKNHAINKAQVHLAEFL